MLEMHIEAGGPTPSGGSSLVAVGFRESVPRARCPMAGSSAPVPAGPGEIPYVGRRTAGWVPVPASYQLVSVRSGSNQAAASRKRRVNSARPTPVVLSRVGTIETMALVLVSSGTLGK